MATPGILPRFTAALHDPVLRLCECVGQTAEDWRCYNELSPWLCASVRASSLESDKDSVVIPTRCSMSKSLLWRGSQVVRHGSAKAVFVGSIPTLASTFFLPSLAQNLPPGCGIWGFDLAFLWHPFEGSVRFFDFDPFAFEGHFAGEVGLFFLDGREGDFVAGGLLFHQGHAGGGYRHRLRGDFWLEKTSGC